MDPILGQIILFGGNFAPQGWAFCNGQLLPISQNAALFSLLGTIYGGDGVRTFALPDLRGRAPIHFGQGPGLSNYALGQVGGQESVTLTVTEMPAHTHSVAPAATSSDATVPDPHNQIFAKTATRTTSTNTYAPASSKNGAMAAFDSAIAGGSQPHSNLQPYVAMNYIIALQGVYPSRP